MDDDKQIWVSGKLKDEIKVAAAKRGLTMRDYLKKLVSDDEARRLRK